MEKKKKTATKTTTTRISTSHHFYKTEGRPHLTQELLESAEARAETVWSGHSPTLYP